LTGITTGFAFTVIRFVIYCAFAGQMTEGTIWGFPWHELSNSFETNVIMSF